MFHPPELARLAYVAAHEEVVDALRASGLPFGVVRPTGFFSAVGALVDMARRGRLPELGHPDARTNPIDDDDLAEVCVEAVEGPPGWPAELSVGGPEIVTRCRMAELAFSAVGKAPRFVRVPSLLLDLAARILWPFHPRNAEVIAFFSRISRLDMIAPTRGRRTLGDFLAATARV